MKTDYPGHENAYQRRRAAGEVGWDSAETYAQRQAVLSRILVQGFAPTSGRVLELGCGAGNISRWLAAQGFTATGIDLSPTAIAWARECAEADRLDAQFVAGNVLQLTDHFPEASFDWVLDGHCFHCILGADRARFLNEAKRILKPGGFLLIDTMAGPVDPEQITGYDAATQCTVFGETATRYFGEPEQIRGEVAAAGFVILQDESELLGSHRNLLIQARKPR